MRSRRGLATASSIGRAFSGAVINAVGCLVVVIDRHGEVVLINHMGEQHTGVTSNKVRGRPFWEVCAVPDDAEKVAAIVRSFVRDGSMSSASGWESHVRSKDGTQRLIAWSPALLRSAAPEYIVITGLDITEQRRMEETLLHQAYHDGLTSLPNRSLLQDRLEQLVRLAERERSTAALLLLDLDRFKEINDALSHHYGDLLLRQVSARLRTVLRAADTLARLGGDEFAVLLLSVDQAGATIVAQKMLAMLLMPYDLEGHTVDVGASIGIALFPEHGTDGATLLRHADVAMYVAKESSDSIALYSAGQDQHSVDRLTLLGDLRDAIADDQLRLYFQPLVDLPGGRLHGVEALLRWEHPSRGYIPPDWFIPLAEQTELIDLLTLWVLEAALRQCQTWHRAGISLGMAVNLSTRTLHDRQLLDTVSWLLARYDVAPGQLTLEITESSLMAEPQRALQMLAQLNELGVRIAIDDFGTGYSSLGYLKHLPVHELKIDKTFVLGMHADKKDVAIVRSTIELAHNMGLTVVAEGVEDRAAWNFLVEMGCDRVQGYFISRPQPRADFDHWMLSTPPMAMGE